MSDRNKCFLQLSKEKRRYLHKHFYSANYERNNYLLHAFAEILHKIPLPYLRYGCRLFVGDRLHRCTLYVIIVST